MFGRKPTKYVLLVLHCGDAKISQVIDAQCGMVVRVYANVEGSYALLRSDGTTFGYSGVAHWVPYLGFTQDELEIYDECFNLAHGWPTKSDGGNRQDITGKVGQRSLGPLEI